MIAVHVSHPRVGTSSNTSRLRTLQQLTAAAGLAVFPAAAFHLLVSFTPAYLSQFAALPLGASLQIHTGNLAVLAGAVPLGGWLADSAGGRAVALCAAGLSAAVAALLWQLIGSGMGAAAWLGQLLLAVPAGMCLGALADAAAAAVPAAVRIQYARCACLFCWRACGLAAHSGTVCHCTHTLKNTNPQAQGTPLAFTHALAAALAGGCAPLAALALAAASGDGAAPGYIMIAAAGVTAASALCARRVD